MSNPAFVLVLALVLALGGCSTRPSSARAPDWEEVDSSPKAVIPNLAPRAPASAQVAAHRGTPTTVSSARVPARHETWVPLRRWSAGRARLTMIVSGPPASYRLESDHGALLLRMGSRQARWNDLDLRLGFGPALINGQPYIHALDLEKIVQPLIEGFPAHPVTSPVVVLDPGHGGADSGALNLFTRHHEEEYTLDWALRLRRLLSAEGFQVYLTRSADVDVSLSDRVAFAAAHKADLFLSLHFNSAAPNETEEGLETYCLTPAGMPSTLTRDAGEDSAAFFPNNAFDLENLRLALTVHHALLGVNGNHDRGVRHARFPAVLRGQQCPAILIEGGYLSSRHEARLIADPAYRQKLAEAVACGVEAWANPAGHP